jgi:elongin-A
MDISPVTNVLWKRFYQHQFGEDNLNVVVDKMKQTGARYKWKDLFKVK